MERLAVATSVNGRGLKFCLRPSVDVFTRLPRTLKDGKATLTGGGGGTKGEKKNSRRGVNGGVGGGHCDFGVDDLSDRQTDRRLFPYTNTRAKEVTAQSGVYTAHLSDKQWRSFSVSRNGPKKSLQIFSALGAAATPSKKRGYKIIQERE